MYNRAIGDQVMMNITHNENAFEGVNEDTTINRDIWEKTVKNKINRRDTFVSKPYNVTCDDGKIEDILKDITVAYSDGPIGYYDGDVYTIETKQVLSMEDVKNFKDEIIKEGKKIILYMILKYENSDNDIKGPNQYWNIRYAAVKE